MRKKLSLSFLLVLSVLAFTGCSVNSGNGAIQGQSNQKLSQKLIKGKTTEAQVVRMFGQPTDKTFKGNGEPEWIYKHSALHNGFVSYIPIVGFFAGDQSQTKKELAILFHKNGTIKDWAWSSSNTPLKAGL